MRPSLILAIASGAIMGANPPEKAEGRGRVDAEAVAKHPAPGTVVPGAIGFTPDGKAVTYLKAEAPDSLESRPLAGRGRRRARPLASSPGPPAAATPTPTSRPRRPCVANASASARPASPRSPAPRTPTSSSAPSKGDVFLLTGDGVEIAERFTNTPAAEIDPKPSKDGKAVAYVRDGDLYALDVASGAERRLTAPFRGRLHQRARRVHRPGGDGPLRWLLVVARWPAPRLSGGRRAAHPRLPHRPSGGRQAFRSRPTAIRSRARPTRGCASASCRLGGGRDTLARPARPRRGGRLPRTPRMGGPGRHPVPGPPQGPEVACASSASTSRPAARLPSIEENSPTWVNLHDDLRVVPATGELLWSSERSGFKHLEVHDRDGKLLRTLTSGDWAVDAVVGLDKARREVWFTAGKDGPPRCTCIASRSTAARSCA